MTDDRRCEDAVDERTDEPRFWIGMSGPHPRPFHKECDCGDCDGDGFWWNDATQENDSCYCTCHDLSFGRRTVSLTASVR